MRQSDSQTESQIDQKALDKSLINLVIGNLDLATAHLYQKLIIDELIHCKDTQQIRGLKLILKQIYRKEDQLEQLKQNCNKKIKQNNTPANKESDILSKDDILKNSYQFEQQLQYNKQFSFAQQLKNSCQTEKNTILQNQDYNCYKQKQYKSWQQEIVNQLVYPAAIYIVSLFVGLFIGCGVFLYQAKLQPQQQDFRFGKFLIGKWVFLSCSTIAFSFVVFTIYDQAIKTFIIEKAQRITELSENSKKERQMALSSRKARKMKQKKQEKESKRNKKVLNQVVS